MEIPPESKVMPLPTSTTGGARGLASALVGHNDELGRLTAALGDREQGAHTELLHIRGLQDLHLQRAVTLAQRLGLFGQIRGRADVSGQVAQGLGQVHAAGDGGPLAPSALSASA